MDADVCYRALRARDARFDGRFFVAVKTTGIYCRPICPARPPKRTNIVFYSTAAAAHAAGYRPCLRCRPECSPGVGSWRGTSNTVARALALIEGGALDDDDLAGLAERVGVGERQLRRLFQKHIGASPIAVAQTRRVHLAKQLVHDTELSMTDIALAAGFHSVRRFNETFLKLFGRPPRELRRSKSDRAGASGVRLILAYRPPYDHRSLFGFLRDRAIEGVEVVGSSRYARTFEIDGTIGHVEVSRSRRSNAFEVVLHAGQVTIIPSIIARVRHLFDLDAEPAVIDAHLSEDPLLRKAIRAHPGRRIPGAWDGFELGVRAILGQQISIGAAAELAGRLVRAFGRRIDAEFGEGLTHVFPTPERLARADIARLGMPRARAAAISALARAAAADPRFFDPGRDPAETTERLRAIPGIGEWTAQYVAMRALRETDSFPPGDLHLEELRAHAEAWRPWRAYAVIHLWSEERKLHAPDHRAVRVTDRYPAARV